MSEAINSQAESVDLTVLYQRPEQLGWHRIDIPAKRAGSESQGMKRSIWCAENFGPCAMWRENTDTKITSFNADQFTYKFNPNGRWIAFATDGAQVFFFRVEEDAVLFRVFHG